MLFDKLFGKKKHESNNQKTLGNNVATNEDRAAALAEYATQSMSFGVVETEPIIPSFQGDYAKTIFLWANSKKSQIKEDNKYPRYIIYECGIERPSEYHQQMIKEGYLTKDSFESALQALKLDQLKEIAAELNVGTSGKKADIAKRIVNSGDISFLERQFPPAYSLSEKGKAFVEEHDDYVQVHRHKNLMIGWTEFDLEKKNNSDKSFYGVCSSILVKRASKDKRLFGRLEYLGLSKLAKEYGDNKQSLCFLLQTLYIDVSGVMGMDAYDSYKKGMYTKESLKNFFISHVMIAGITDSIKDLKDYYDPSILETLFTWKLPVMICDRDTFTNIVNDIVNGTFNQQFYMTQLKMKYDSFIDSL